MSPRPGEGGLLDPSDGLPTRSGSQAERHAWAAERERIRREYARRAAEVPVDRYAPWQPDSQLHSDERRRTAADLLRSAGAWPLPGDRALEVGCGTRGWLCDLLAWGLRARDLAGVDVDAERLAVARDALPEADLREVDATELPWPDSTFQLVVTSTLLSSVLSASVRQRIADEVVRVLADGGALVYYDLARANPLNRNVSAISEAELRGLFSRLGGEVRRVTLAPPLARAVAPRSWPLATLLQAIRPLRTHLLAVLVKGSTVAPR